MTTLQTVLLAIGVVATLAICICCVVGLGQLHRQSVETSEHEAAVPGG